MSVITVVPAHVQCEASFVRETLLAEVAPELFNSRVEQLMVEQVGLRFERCVALLERKAVLSTKSIIIRWCHCDLKVPKAPSVAVLKVQNKSICTSPEHPTRLKSDHTRLVIFSSISVSYKFNLVWILQNQECISCNANFFITMAEMNKAFGDLRFIRGAIA